MAVGSEHKADDPPGGWGLDIRIPPLGLEGSVVRPEAASGLVIFVHGSGSSRFSPRNNAVARALNQAGLATCLFDLLLPEEADDRRKVFDIPLLTERLLQAHDALTDLEALAGLPFGYYGASTGAAAALCGAAEKGDEVAAVVSRGGRPDLAAPFLDRVTAPTLLIVGGLDDVVIELNEQAYALLTCEKALEIVPGATHLFEEPGTLDQVTQLATHWFLRHFANREGAA